MLSLHAFLTFLLVNFVPISSLNLSCFICPTETEYNKFHHQRHTWVIENKLISPDNYQQVGKVINGEFPGPTITVKVNTCLIVKVINKTPEPISIHWHGLHQEYTMAADGVPYVTQDPINPGTEFIYCMFIGKQPGTYMYHGHLGMDIVWIHGSLIVQDLEPHLISLLGGRGYHYDDERTLIFELLYHDPLSQLMEALLVGGVPRPSVKSLLINGRSYGEWPDSNNGGGEGYSIITVRKGLTYRFRLINLSSDLLFQFYIPGHKMTVIEMDGIYTDPVEVDFVQIHTGQRYSVIVTMNQAVDNYWMDIRRVPGPGPKNGAAILHYETAPDPTTLRKTVRSGSTEMIPITQWITDKLHPASKLHLIQHRVYPVPRRVDRTIIMDFGFKSIPPVFRIVLNGHMYKNPDETYLFQVRQGKNITDGLQVFETIAGEDVQIIYQSRAGSMSNCDPHPWHMHGRYFYVVAKGPDVYDPIKDSKIIQEAVEHGNGRFEFRDVFTQYSNQIIKDTTPGVGCGWYAVRFKANNPGIWLNHCHITTHMVLGKMFVIYEHTRSNPRLIGE